MNHKRKRPKNRRAGCLMCKAYKVNGCAKVHQMNWSDRKRYEATKFALKCD